jgi:hypothetical protein
VGFLGRAHPLVRRALERVRHLSYGGAAGLDPRVSAVAADVPRQRLADLDARLALATPEVIGLGALMLVPRGA